MGCWVRIWTFDVCCHGLCHEISSWKRSRGRYDFLSRVWTKKERERETHRRYMKMIEHVFYSPLFYTFHSVTEAQQRTIASHFQVASPTAATVFRCGLNFVNCLILTEKPKCIFWCGHCATHRKRCGQMALTNPCGGKVSQHLPNVIGSDVNQARKFMGRCSSSSCSSFHVISVTILT